MEARKATDVMVLEIGRVTPVADYFVICSAETGVQIRAIGAAVDEALSRAGVRLLAQAPHARAPPLLLVFPPPVVPLLRPAPRPLPPPPPPRPPPPPHPALLPPP